MSQGRGHMQAFIPTKHKTKGLKGEVITKIVRFLFSVLSISFLLTHSRTSYCTQADFFGVIKSDPMKLWKSTRPSDVCSPRLRHIYAVVYWYMAVSNIPAKNRCWSGQKENFTASSVPVILLEYPWPNSSSIVWPHTLTSRRALPHSLPISHPCSSLSHTTCLSIYTVESVCHWQQRAIRKIESSRVRNTSIHLSIYCLKREHWVSLAVHQSV